MRHNQRASRLHSRTSETMTTLPFFMTDTRITVFARDAVPVNDLQRPGDSVKGCPEHKVACKFPRRSVVH